MLKVKKDEKSINRCFIFVSKASDCTRLHFLNKINKRALDCYRFTM